MVNKEMAALWAFAQARNDPSCGDIADEVVSEPFVMPLPIERAGRRDGWLLLTSQLLRPAEVRHPRATCTGKYVHGLNELRFGPALTFRPDHDPKAFSSGVETEEVELLEALMQAHHASAERLPRVPDALLRAAETHTLTLGVDSLTRTRARGHATSGKCGRSSRHDGEGLAR
jgi:hypothetical protein